MNIVRFAEERGSIERAAATTASRAFLAFISPGTFGRAGSQRAEQRWVQREIWWHIDQYNR
jgi:hypothetical protein